MGWNIIRRLYPEEINKFGILEKPFLTGNSHLMISRKYPKAQLVREKFNQALKQIKENGTCRKIMERYGLSDPE
ncbi:hypothetical protein QUF70_00795 [Desulfobacterales bacterium HSG17]|nr:hypothetical protein [Desulfobacterales bacterium HSG17]